MTTDAVPDETTGTTQRAEGPARPAPRAPSPRLRRAWLLVDLSLVALVLVALVMVAVSARSALDQRAEARARADALAAARQLALRFTSLDYRTFDRDAQQVAELAGGELHRQFAAERPVLKKAMTSNRSVTHGTVLDAAVVDADRDSARVLLVVDAAVTNTSTTDPAARHYRMQLDLSRQRGRWLGTDLTFVG